MVKILNKLKGDKNLSVKEMSAVLEAIMTGNVSNTEIEEFLLWLRQKGESVEEITAAARVMRKYSLKTTRPHPKVVDTCGTGGDGCRTLNVSTLSAIVAAAAGAKVAKHGNRSISSSCGSADLLEMLGVKIDLPLEKIEEGIETAGFGFFFAPNFHPALKYAMPARKKIGGKTLFNLLGPLTNPAGAKYQLMGVYDPKWVEPIARVLKALGCDRAMVVHGSGMDEISTVGTSKVSELQNGQVKTYAIDPEDFGITPATLEDLRCESRESARDMALKILNGQQGPPCDIVCLNAGAVLTVAGQTSSLGEGLQLARRTVQSGEALRKLTQIAEYTQR